LDPFTLIGLGASLYGVYRIFHKGGFGHHEMAEDGRPFEIPFLDLPRNIGDASVSSAGPAGEDTNQEERAMAGKSTVRRCRELAEQVQAATTECSRIAMLFVEHGRNPFAGTGRNRTSGDAAWHAAQKVLLDRIGEAEGLSGRLAEEEHQSIYTGIYLALQAQHSICRGCESMNRTRLAAGEAFVCRIMDDAEKPQGKAAEPAFFLDDSGNIAIRRE